MVTRVNVYLAVSPARQIADTREAIVAALKASAAGEIPSRGPRGGVRWTAQYFVRRVAWHVMAHAWEIERRVAPRILRVAGALGAARP
jgi:hypothetical protein